MLPGQVAEPVAEVGPAAGVELVAEVGPAAAAESVVAVEAGDGRPGDRAGAPFELVAANLQWPFDSGSESIDAVDAALLAHAERSGRTAALFRTWVRDPDGGWVRVVLGYVGPRSSIADVDAERTAVVEMLQQAGAARCCVEVLAAVDVSDAHRWLEQRCHPLKPAAPRPAPPAASDGAPPSRPHEPAAPDSAVPEPPRLDPSAVADGAVPDRPSRFAPPAVPDNAVAAPPSRPDPAWAPDGGLSADVVFRPGPAADDPEHADVIAALVGWATDRAGVVGLLTAWTGEGTLVVGVALDGRTDPGDVSGAVAALAPGALVEQFAPSRGLDPLHLRLTRSSTRLWTRRADRAGAEPTRAAAGGLQPPAAPAVTSLGPPPVRDTADPRGDVALAGGFLLVGIDREVAVTKGSAEPDERDAQVVEWARGRTGAIALLRGRAAAKDGEIPVYCLCVAADVDPEAARRDLGAAVAATGVASAAAEAFAPAGTISAFHLDLAVGSTRLWTAPPA